MDACDACTRFREGGGIVVLVSNSPRPHDERRRAARRPRRAALELGRHRHLRRRRPHADRAPTRGGPSFTSARSATSPRFAGLGVVRVDAGRRRSDRLHGAVRRRARDAGRLCGNARSSACARGLPMICANPDVMVERGGRMIYCAGAIARAYEALGGKVAYAGKPYAPIYDADLRDAGEAEGRKRRQGASSSPSATASAPTSPAPPRRACARCSSPAACMSKAGSTPRPSRRLFPPGAPRPVAAMTKLAW